MAIESLYAESQVSTTILRKRAYLDGYAARLLVAYFGAMFSTQSRCNIGSLPLRGVPFLNL